MALAIGRTGRICEGMRQIVIRAASRYTSTAIVLHWLLAVLILGNLALGLSAESFPDSLVRPVIDFHKSIGLTVLGLVLLRIIWRATHPPPPLPEGFGRAERLGAHAAHYALYALILLMPLTGWMHDSAFKDAAAHPLRIFWVIPWFRIPAIAHMPPGPKEAFHGVLFAIHADAAWVLLALLALHVLGALKHQFLDRQPELQRMWPR
jgi:cytochrome b561